jgi:hypothetical protein
MSRVKLPTVFRKLNNKLYIQSLAKIQLPNKSQCYPLILYVTKAQHYHTCNPLLNWQTLLEHLLLGITLL